MRVILALVAILAGLAAPVMAQDERSGPLRIEITEGVIEPLPFAVPNFVAESAQAQEMAANITRVIAADLTGTGLFRGFRRTRISRESRRFPARFNSPTGRRSTRRR